MTAPDTPGALDCRCVGHNICYRNTLPLSYDTSEQLLKLQKPTAFEDNPKYVIYVAVDKPRERYYGSEVAAPLFSRVAGYAVRKAGLAPVFLRVLEVGHQVSSNCR